jgi:hypothetical protein
MVQISNPKAVFHEQHVHEGFFFSFPDINRCSRMPLFHQLPVLTFACRMQQYDSEE